MPLSLSLCEKRLVGRRGPARRAEDYCALLYQRSPTSNKEQHTMSRCGESNSRPFKESTSFSVDKFLSELHSHEPTPVKHTAIILTCQVLDEIDEGEIASC